MCQEVHLALHQDRVLAFLRAGRSDPIADSWFGRGYAVSVGEGTSPLRLRVFPEGGVVSLQSDMIRLEVGRISQVSQHENVLQIEGFSATEQVIVELAPTGEFVFTRATSGRGNA